MMEMYAYIPIFMMEICAYIPIFVMEMCADIPIFMMAICAYRPIRFLPAKGNVSVSKTFNHIYLGFILNTERRSLLFETQKMLLSR